MDEQAPLDLGPQKRMQAAKIDLAGSRHWRRPQAPAPERRLVDVTDRDWQAGPLVAIAPLHRQRRLSGSAFAAVAAKMPVAQRQRRLRQSGTDLDPAASVTRMGLLLGKPNLEVGGIAVAVTIVIPAELVMMTQLQGQLAGRERPRSLRLTPDRAKCAGSRP